EDLPKSNELKKEQQERLKESYHLVEDFSKLRAEGKVPEAIAACEKILAVKRDVLGPIHPEVASWLQQLAELHLQCEDFTAARKARAQLVDITTKVFGDKHWRTVDARVALADVEGLARLDRDQRRRLTEAD